MIKNIIFDFGDVFINLDKPATIRKMEKLGYQDPTPKFEHLIKRYEKGLISTKKFIFEANNIYTEASPEQLIDAWNAIILDFPEYRLEFLENLAKEREYRLFLLSNTNELHVEKVIQNMGAARFKRFKNCFDRFYLSHEIHHRKPDMEIYQFVLDNNQLNVSETLFIDDTPENTDTAEKLGVKTWNLKVGSEDIINLKSKL